jgi:hypothetical protein
MIKDWFSVNEGEFFMKLWLKFYKVNFLLNNLNKLFLWSKIDHSQKMTDLISESKW